MKKIVTAFSFIFLLFMICSCKEKNKEQNTPQSSVQNQVSSANAETVENKKKKETIPSVVLYDETPFYTENKDGKMVYADYAILGESILMYVDGQNPEQKEAIRLLSNGKEEKFNFVHVKYDDNDYWTRDIFVTSRRIVMPAVVTEDTLIYESPEGTGATSKKLDSGTLIAADTVVVETDEDIGISFIPVVIYNGTPFGREVYLKSNAISKSEADVTFIQTANAIKKTKNLKPEVREQIKNRLFTMSVSSGFIDMALKMFDTTGSEK